jgi:uncharacterized protein (DUF2147 family)
MKFVPVLLAAMLPISAQAAAPVTGKWMTEERDSIIEIGQCGNTVCGKVASILKPTADGKPAIDSYNPNPALRNRPVLGINILNGFTDGGTLWNGQIYDPRKGKTYKSKLTRNANGTLKVQGCIAFLCQTQVWTPVK